MQQHTYSSGSKSTPINSEKLCSLAQLKEYKLTNYITMHNNHPTTQHNAMNCNIKCVTKQCNKSQQQYITVLQHNNTKEHNSNNKKQHNTMAVGIIKLNYTFFSAGKYKVHLLKYFTWEQF